MRDMTETRQWIIVRPTGRSGDWIVVEADSEEAARKKVPRSLRKRDYSLWEVLKLEKNEAGIIESPPITKRRRRR